MAYNITKLRSTSTIKKVAFIFIIIISLIIINKQDLVDKARQDLNVKKQENEELKVQLTYVKSNEFVESQARDKLFLVKPGESAVIVPPELIKKKKKEKPPPLPAWKQWVNLFLGK